MPLNPSQVKTLQPGAHTDGNGLYLVVRDTGERSWSFRFTEPAARPDGKHHRAAITFAKADDRDSAIGDVLTLKSARTKAREYAFALKRDGIDPRHKKKIDISGGLIFRTFAEQQYPEWCKGLYPEELKAWQRAIRDVPGLHGLKLHEIETSHVLAALKPIWTVKPVTAARTRQRIERVLDAAKALKLRTGENPAAWRGNLKHLLPSPRKLHRKKGHTALPYSKAPALMQGLELDPAIVARCVEVAILTVARSQEVRLMEWTEIDFDKREWMCPADKMKIKQGSDEKAKDHLVPLSDQAIEILLSLPRTGRYVFPSDHNDEHAPFRPNALTGCIKRDGFDVTMHGMRTSFRNWGGDGGVDGEHSFPREVLEHCLAHREGDETERSYWTGEMKARRRVVLQAWADYIRPKTKAKPKSKTNLRLVA
jgi:integrase